MQYFHKQILLVKFIKYTVEWLLKKPSEFYLL